MSSQEYINIAMMPLRKNIPTTSNEDWQLTTCPECGRECWRMGKNANLVENMCPGTRFLCTECALSFKWAAAETKQTERQIPKRLGF